MADNPQSTDYQSKTSFDKTATILISTTTSNVIDLGGNVITGLIMPAAFTGTSVTIQSSDSVTGTFTTIYDGVAGADFALTVAASKTVKTDKLSLLFGLRYIKIISGSTEIAERAIKLMLAPM